MQRMYDLLNDRRSTPIINQANIPYYTLRLKSVQSSAIFINPLGGEILEVKITPFTSPKYNFYWRAVNKVASYISNLWVKPLADFLNAHINTSKINHPNIPPSELWIEAEYIGEIIGLSAWFGLRKYWRLGARV